MISFNNIPTTTRTPNVYAEIDNSRALQGLATNPHKALIMAQKAPGLGTVDVGTLIAISNDSLADGYFGTGGQLARMCNAFKAANPNTELYAIAVSTNATVLASAVMYLSDYFNSATYSGTGYLYMLVNGTKVKVTLTSNMTPVTAGSAIVALINASTYSHTGIICSESAANNSAVVFKAVCSGSQGNYLNIRFNYYAGESFPRGFSTNPTNASFVLAGGDSDTIGFTSAWAVLEDEQFHYIIQPYSGAASLTSLETELENRFLPTEDIQGHGFTCYGATTALCTTLGNSRNSPYNTVFGIYDSPTAPEEIAATAGAVAAKYLNIDPARPLHFLKLPNVLPPPVENRFTRAEREVLLYDGIATTITDSGGNQLIERCITTFQSNALGLPDWSYLDIQTMATLSEIRYQFKTRMINRFIQPRFKLADDSFPVRAGTYVATPSTIKNEIVSLFYLLRDRGLIENIDEFVENLIVERDSTDRNRINVLLSPDLINQFRVLAGKIMFVL